MATRHGTSRTATPRRGFERRPPPRPSRALATKPSKATKQSKAPKPSRAVTGAVARRRLRVIRVMVLVVFVVIAGRLVMVQVFSGSRYSSIGASEVTSIVQVPAVRGGIFDRNGAVLATSVPRTTIVADPFLIHHPGTEAAALAPVLGQSAATLRSEMSEDSGFVYLAHKVDDTVAKRVSSLNLVGINLLPDSQRVDPAGQLASPLLGEVGTEGTGLAGLEYQYNGLLAGRSGTDRIEQSPSGVTLPGSTTQLATSKAGSGIELTLDEPLQYVAEQALGSEIAASHAKSGTPSS